MKFPLYVKVLSGIAGVTLIALGVSGAFDGSSSSSPTSSPSPTSSSGCPASITTWGQNGGLTDLDSLATALDGVSPTATTIDQAQLSTIDSALSAAASDPAPAGIGDSYNAAIAAYQAGDAAYSNGDVQTFISQYTAGNQDVHNFESALNTAGCK